MSDAKLKLAADPLTTPKFPVIAPFTVSEPLETSVSPVYEFIPAKINVPVLTCSTIPVPVIIPEKLTLPLRSKIKREELVVNFTLLSKEP